MADCADTADGHAAIAAGAPIVATTLCGYTSATRGAALPAIDLLAAWQGQGAFVICEGGVASPHDVRAALSAGADAVVVGTAITNIDALVRKFFAATKPT
jgi:N-acylglucosamine-6-phosphate 2-epimerase